MLGLTTFSTCLDLTSQPEIVQMKFDLLKNGKLDVVKGAGHLLTLEKPQESGTALEEKQRGLL